MIVDSKTMAQIDTETIAISVSGAALMENAGRLIAEEIIRSHEGRKVFIFSGPGNNGGDGFVVARHLFKKGFSLEVFVLCHETEIRGDSRVNFDLLQKIKSVHFINNINDIKDNYEKDCNPVMVDAIFGTGLKSEIKGIYAEVVNFINSIEKKTVISVDIPSGISADNGNVFGVAVKADLTITFVLPKFGHYIYPGKEYTGELKVVDIGVPDSIIKKFKIPDNLIDEKYLRPKIVKRKPDSNKYSYGHAIIYSGSVGKVGAAVLSSRAAMKAGAGLVTLIVPQNIYNQTSSNLIEVMVEQVWGEMTLESFKNSFDKLNNVKVVAIGPGIGISSETEKILLYLLEKEIDLLIDADAIKLLKNHLSKLKSNNNARIITPHMGEFLFLLGIEKKYLLKNKLEISRRFAKEYQIHILLKGNDTIVASPDGAVSVNTSGNPAMANAGQGDALTGFITGLISSGYDAKNALELAAFLHGRCGDFLARKMGPIGVLASEVINEFPAEFKKLL